MRVSCCLCFSIISFLNLPLWHVELRILTAKGVHFGVSPLTANGASDQLNDHLSRFVFLARW